MFDVSSLLCFTAKLNKRSSLLVLTVSDKEKSFVIARLVIL